MDALVGLLDGVRARGAFVLRIARSAVVDAHSGRRTADPDLPDRRRGGAVPDGAPRP